jgi:phosphoglycolate phosphatase
MKCKGIIFDLDGTLLNSLQGIADTGNVLLKKLGYKGSYDLDYYKERVGEGLKELILQLIPMRDRSRYDFDNLVVDYNKIYANIWREGTMPYAGIKPLLTALIQREIKISILSNKSDNYVKLITGELLGDFEFTCVRGVVVESVKKPDPVIALQIAKRMGLKPQEIIFIGDTAIDVLTARNAGMKSIGVLWGFRGEAELLKYKADLIVKSPMEILKSLAIISQGLNKNSQ